MDPSGLLIIVVAIVAMLFFSSRSAKKNRARLEEQREQAMKPGTWVVTMSGYYGRFVDLDGDVVVLENLDGTETLWSKQAIARAAEPPFAGKETEETAESSSSVTEDNEPEDGDETVALKSETGEKVSAEADQSEPKYGVRKDQEPDTE